MAGVVVLSICPGYNFGDQVQETRPRDSHLQGSTNPEVDTSRCASMVDLVVVRGRQQAKVLSILFGGCNWWAGGKMLMVFCHVICRALPQICGRLRGYTS